MNATYIHPTQLSESDIAAIARGCLKIRFQKLDPQHMVRMALSGNLAFYRLRGENFEGLFAVAPRDNTLWLELAVGRNLLKHFDEIQSWLQGLARSYGAHSLSAIIASSALSKLWQRRQAKNVAAYFVQEF